MGTLNWGRGGSRVTGRAREDTPARGFQDSVSSFRRRLLPPRPGGGGGEEPSGAGRPGRRPGGGAWRPRPPEPPVWSRASRPLRALPPASGPGGPARSGPRSPVCRPSRRRTRAIPDPRTRSGRRRLRPRELSADPTRARGGAGSGCSEQPCGPEVSGVFGRRRLTRCRCPDSSQLPCRHPLSFLLSPPPALGHLALLPLAAPGLWGPPALGPGPRGSQSSEDGASRRVPARAVGLCRPSALQGSGQARGRATAPRRAGAAGYLSNLAKPRGEDRQELELGGGGVQPGLSPAVSPTVKTNNLCLHIKWKKASAQSSPEPGRLSRLPPPPSEDLEVSKASPLAPLAPSTSPFRLEVVPHPCAWLRLLSPRGSRLNHKNPNPDDSRGCFRMSGQAGWALVRADPLVPS